jgi:hypothetical protein
MSCNCNCTDTHDYLTEAIEDDTMEIVRDFTDGLTTRQIRVIEGFFEGTAHQFGFPNLFHRIATALCDTAERRT